MSPIIAAIRQGYLKIVTSDGGFFSVWTLYAVGITGTMSTIQAARALWRWRKAGW